MENVKGELILYGIENINENLDNIVGSLGLKDSIFEVKLIISEAITNAFIHGNNSDKTKPINVKWDMNGNNLCIQVKDCGRDNKDFEIDTDIDNSDFLSESGRGLFIISSYADEVEFKENTLIMKKVV
ncbi:ATP-binding protein [uncultured Clostridium sp.]|uniref:ATP-binding protein n=1 Tax=uncultured Clostridium sp. TaxID=59620 RepID=UPI0025DF454B|nr:ATP-binding protein [uncultured Clostridium sp.]